MDYLAKARKLMPQKKDMIIGRPERFGFNECLSLCLPIVADLLKRVDSLQQAHNYNIDKITELEEEVKKQDKAYEYTYGQYSKYLELSDRYKQALEEISKLGICFTCGASDIAQTALEGKR